MYQAARGVPFPNLGRLRRIQRQTDDRGHRSRPITCVMRSVVLARPETKRAVCNWVERRRKCDVGETLAEPFVTREILHNRDRKK